jgi:aminoglycoside 3-N-acetyltransferase I
MELNRYRSFQLLQPGDTNKLTELLKVFEEAFEMKPFAALSPDYLNKLLQQPNFLIMTASVDEKIVGGLTSYLLPQYYSQTVHAYIHDLAVHSSFQRKGIGRQLIDAFMNECKKREIQEVFVAAEKADDYALEFYRATGAEELESVHFFYKLS